MDLAKVLRQVIGESSSWVSRSDSFIHSFAHSLDIYPQLHARYLGHLIEGGMMQKWNKNIFFAIEKTGLIHLDKQPNRYNKNRKHIIRYSNTNKAYIQSRHHKRSKWLWLYQRDVIWVSFGKVSWSGEKVKLRKHILDKREWKSMIKLGRRPTWYDGNKRYFGER